MVKAREITISGLADWFSSGSKMITSLQTATLLSDNVRLTREARKINQKLEHEQAIREAQIQNLLRME